MILDDLLKWFEENPTAKPNDLPENVASVIRLGRTGEVAIPVDVLVRFYCLHLKKMNKALPKGPADYTHELIDEAVHFFDYVGDRCLCTYLQKEGLYSYEDPDVPLLESDIANELKTDVTEKGKQFFEDLNSKIQEAIKKQQDEKAEKKDEEKK